MKRIRNHNVAALILFLSAFFGLAHVVSTVSKMVARMVSFEAILVTLREVDPQYVPTAKIFHLSFYCGSLGALIAFSFLAYFFLKGEKIKKNQFLDTLINRSDPKFYFGYLILLLAVSYYSMLAMNSHLLFLLWLALMSLPFWEYFKVGGFSRRKQRVFYLAVLFLLMADFFFLFGRFIFREPQVLNDYMDIPEQTFLSAKGSVDNTDFINRHRLAGLLKYDPRIDTTPHLDLKKLGMLITADENVVRHLEEREHLFFVKNSQERSISPPQPNFKKSLWVEVNGKLPLEEYSQLKALLRKEDVAKLNRLFRFSREMYGKKGIYSSDSVEFFSKNLLELSHQVLAGHFFHHHHCQLGPINERLLGKNPMKIDYPYGWINSIMLGKLMKILGE